MGEKSYDHFVKNLVFGVGKNWRPDLGGVVKPPLKRGTYGDCNLSAKGQKPSLSLCKFRVVDREHPPASALFPLILRIFRIFGLGFEPVCFWSVHGQQPS